MWGDVGYGQLSDQTFEADDDLLIPSSSSSSSIRRPSSALLQQARLRKFQSRLRPADSACRLPLPAAAPHPGAASLRPDCLPPGQSVNPVVDADEAYKQLVAAAPSKRLTLSRAEAYWVRFAKEHAPVLNAGVVSERMYGLAMQGALAILRTRLDAAVRHAADLKALSEEAPPPDLKLQEEMDLFADYCEEIENDPDVPEQEKRRAAERWEELLEKLAASERAGEQLVEARKRQHREALKAAKRAQMLLDEHMALRIRRRPRAVANGASLLDSDAAAATFQTVVDLLQYSDRELKSRAEAEEKVLAAKRRGELPWDDPGDSILAADEVSATQAVCAAAMDATELTAGEFERLYLAFLSRL